jgi:hypothetical protein
MKELRAPRGSERERQRLIDRLKTVKDPQERAKILWTLEGMRKDSYGPTGSQTQEGEPVAQEKEMPRIPAQPPKGFSLLVQFAAPVFFILFGLAFILQAVFRGLEKRDFASEAGQFITGAIFLVFGFGALQRARKLAQTPKDS